MNTQTNHQPVLHLISRSPAQINDVTSLLLSIHEHDTIFLLGDGSYCLLNMIEWLADMPSNSTVYVLSEDANNRGLGYLQNNLQTNSINNNIQWVDIDQLVTSSLNTQHSINW